MWISAVPWKCPPTSSRCDLHHLSLSPPDSSARWHAGRLHVLLRLSPSPCGDQERPTVWRLQLGFEALFPLTYVVLFGHEP